MNREPSFTKKEPSLPKIFGLMMLAFFIMALVAFFVFGVKEVRAEELPAPVLVQDLVMPINVGDDRIVLTVKPCPIVNERGFNDEAYAIIENELYPACWNKYDHVVSIWFYVQKGLRIASYAEYYFTPLETDTPLAVEVK